MIVYFTRQLGMPVAALIQPPGQKALHWVAVGRLNTKDGQCNVVFYDSGKRLEAKYGDFFEWAEKGFVRPFVSPLTLVTPVPPTVGFNIEDECYGSRTQVRFFEYNRNDAPTSSARVWPNPQEAYVLDDSERDYNLTCRPGHLVCYGANSLDDSGWWGIDIDGSQSCDDCCLRCPAIGKAVTMRRDLTCK